MIKKKFLSRLLKYFILCTPIFFFTSCAWIYKDPPFELSKPWQYWGRVSPLFLSLNIFVSAVLAFFIECCFAFQKEQNQSFFQKINPKRAMILWGCFLFVALFADYQSHAIYEINTHCLVKGTNVQTPEGPVEIQNLSPGDVVLSESADGTMKTSRVMKVHKYEVEKHLRIEFNSKEELMVTGRHPIRSENEWQLAKNIQEGQQVQCKNGHAEVKSTELIHRTTTVYNLTVQPHANFFAETVRVHNKTKKNLDDHPSEE